MKITLSIDKVLAKDIRKIAADRGTTVTAPIRSHLRGLVGEHAKSADQRSQLQALERSFESLQFKLGEKTWTREELYERPSSRKWSI